MNEEQTPGAHAERVGRVPQLRDGGERLWPGDAGEGYLDAVELVCRRHDVVVLWLDGNHEDIDRLARYPIAPNGLRPIRPNVAPAPRDPVDVARTGVARGRRGRQRRPGEAQHDIGRHSSVPLDLVPVRSRPSRTTATTQVPTRTASIFSSCS